MKRTFRDWKEPLHSISIISALQYQCRCCPNSHCALTDVSCSQIWLTSSKTCQEEICCISQDASTQFKPASLHLSCILIFVMMLEHCLCLCLGSLFCQIEHSGTRCRGYDRAGKQIYTFIGSCIHVSVHPVVLYAYTYAPSLWEIQLV